jgi:putative sterol carrier protein
MAYFADEDEIYEYIGGIFRRAGEHPEVGPKLAAANIRLRLNYTEPDATMLVRFEEPITVENGPGEGGDVELTLSGDIADRYWRGDYNLAVGMAKGKVKAKGPVNKILKLVPLTKPLFPIYQDLVAEKDGARA